MTIQITLTIIASPPAVAWGQGYSLPSLSNKINNLYGSLHITLQCTLGQSNYIISFSSIHFHTFMRAGGNYSLFIAQYYGILRVQLPGTAQISNKKGAWLAF